MSADLTPAVVARLNTADHGWLTTVAKSGQPVPKLVWFLFDGAALFVYSAPDAAKVRHVKAHPQVSLNLDSDGNGGGIVVIGGEATIDAEGADCRTDEPFWAKYSTISDDFGLTDSMANYSTRLRITVDKVWVTPTEE